MRYSARDELTKQEAMIQEYKLGLSNNAKRSRSGGNRRRRRRRRRR